MVTIVTEATGTTTTIYSGNYIYQNNVLQMINQPEGYLEPNGQGDYDYGYRLKDHLGNIRITFVDFDHNGSIALSEITEENNYYPFGLKHQGYNFVVNSNTNAVANKFKYNSKELNDELGLDWYDYGARFYDAALGRWHVVDQLAEKFNDYSPYCYVGNNPISRFDPDGRDWLTDKDKEKAKQLQEQSRNQIQNLGKSNSTLNQKISEAKEKGNEKKVTRLEQQRENNNSQIADLNKGIDEIQFLGDTKDYTFTYTYISGDGNNHVSLLKDGEKPLISIEHSTDALAMHESRHSFQYITEGKSSGRMVFDKNSSYLSYTSENATIWYETRAHQLQYSFSNSSLPMNASAFYGINKNWLKSLPGNPYQIK